VYNFLGENEIKKSGKKEKSLIQLFDILFELINYIYEYHFNLKELNDDKYDIFNFNYWKQYFSWNNKIKSLKVQI